MSLLATESCMHGQARARLEAPGAHRTQILHEPPSASPCQSRRAHGAEHTACPPQGAPGAAPARGAGAGAQQAGMLSPRQPDRRGDQATFTARRSPRPRTSS